MESICRHVLDEDGGIGGMILSRQLQKLFQLTFFWKGQSPDSCWKFLVDTYSHIATLAVSLARFLEVVLFQLITVVMDSSLTLTCLPWTFWMSMTPWFPGHLRRMIWWIYSSSIEWSECFYFSPWFGDLMKFGIRPCMWHRSRRICHLHSLSKFETLEVRAYGTFSTFVRPAPFRWRVGNNFQTATSVGKEWGRFWWDDLTDIRESRYSRSKHWNHIGFDSLKWPPQISPSRHLIHWSCSSGQKRWAILIPKWQRLSLDVWIWDFMMQMRSVDIFVGPLRLGWKVHGRRVTEVAGGDLPNAVTFGSCN